MNKIYLEKEQIEFSKLSVIDDVGKVFYYKNKVFRGIYTNKVSKIMELLNSGLIDELMHKKFIPKTKISSYYTDEFPLILEHERVETVSYVYEWTFDMIKDAAKLVLDISDVSLKYGYVLKDCHSYNILFNRCSPLYVDFGSFIKNESYVYPYKEFSDSYIFPLLLLNKKYPSARDILFNVRRMELCDYKYKLLIPAAWIRGIHFWDRVIIKLIGMAYRKKAIGDFLTRYFIKKYRKKIASLRLIEKSEWGAYHHQTINHTGSLINKTSRFQRIYEIVDKLNVASVLEIAGNSGAMSLQLSNNDKIKRIVCTDYDENAINRLYCLIKDNGEMNRHFYKVFPLQLNFTIECQHINLESFVERMKSDLVIAMAITHHLLLSQYVDIERMMDKFYQYTNRYIIVEFMPLGLWGGGEFPPIPSWYTLEWFKENMSKKFHILLEEKLEINRIVLLGEKIDV